MKSHRPPLEGGPPQTGFADEGVHGWVKHHVAVASSRTVLPCTRLTVADREAGREMRMRAAAAGCVHRFKLLSGTCPWWVMG